MNTSQTLALAILLAAAPALALAEESKPAPTSEVARETKTKPRPKEKDKPKQPRRVGTAGGPEVDRPDRVGTRVEVEPRRGTELEVERAPIEREGIATEPTSPRTGTEAPRIPGKKKPAPAQKPGHGGPPSP